MYRIGEFSKLAKVTVKALRFYEEAGLLTPARVDGQTGSRYYTTDQLCPLQQIAACRQAGLSIEEIRCIRHGGAVLAVLEQRRAALAAEQTALGQRLLHPDHMIREERERKQMGYQAVVKQLPEYTVYYRQGRIRDFTALTPFILGANEAFQASNPALTLAEPDYCYVSYLDPEFKNEEIQIEYAQAVIAAGRETAEIRFKVLPPVSAVCVYHRGSYAGLGAAYAYAVNWAKENGYQISGLPREHYIDGMWNRFDEVDWLTEIQFPVVQYGKETQKQWGDTAQYADSQAKADARGAEAEMTRVRDADDIFAAFAALRTADPAAPAALALVERWQAHITRYHYPCTREILASLGEMYAADARFTENIDRFGAGTAQFMSAAIAAYCRQ